MSIIADAQSILRAAATILDRKGYDSVSVRDLSISASGELTIHYGAEDEFQSSLDSSDRYHSGYFQSASAETLEELYEKLDRLPSRRKRELSVLSQQTARLGHQLEHLTDEFVKEFVQSILDDATELHAQLEDLR